MKVLVIGMDGASLKTFKRGWTPFISSLIDNGNTLNIYEDLISRGWSEIYTGKDASVTGALYDRAALNGTYEWSLNFSLQDIPDIGNSVKPIWQVLNENGFRVGIMNMPTVTTAQKVDGFFVSGGGGGKVVVQQPEPEHCFPESIHEKLVAMDYIIDERIESLVFEKKLNEPKDLFERLSYKNNRRTDAFIELSKEFKIDFGFIVYKSSSNLAEYFSIPEIERAEKGSPEIDYDLLHSIQLYYETFDNEIKKLIQSFKNTEIIFVADHAMVSRNYLVNLNKFLQENNFQIPQMSKSFIHNSFVIFKKKIPNSLRVTLKKNAKLKKIYRSAIPFDTKKSRAFFMPTGIWAHGIYINDKKRFGGPVDEKERKTISEKIIDIFNSNSIAVEHSLIAKLQPETTSNPHFPDVIIEFKDGYMTTNEGNAFIEKFSMPKGKIGLREYMNTRCNLTGHGHYPVAVSIGSRWNLANKERYGLVDIYEHIVNRFRVIKYEYRFLE